MIIILLSWRSDYFVFFAGSSFAIAVIMRQVKSRSAIVHLRTAVSPFWARRIGIANRRASEPYVREHKGEHANRMKPSGEIGEADKLILINLYNVGSYAEVHPGLYLVLQFRTI